MIASEYGYTFDQIMDMTPREIQISLEMISIRKHNNFASNASLHGKKIPFKYPKTYESENNNSKFNKKEDLALTNWLQDRIKRKA